MPKPTTERKRPPRKGEGRPRKEIDEPLALKLAGYGHTNEEIADCLNIERTTLYRYCEANEKFCNALKSAKLEADMKIAESLFKRATGFEYTETEITHENNHGKPVVVKQVTRKKFYPPDVAAISRWQNNRQRALWRDKWDEDTTDDGALPSTVEMVYD